MGMAAGPSGMGRDANPTSVFQGKLSRRSVLAGAGALALSLWTRTGWGARREEGDNSPQSREEAIRSLPLKNMTAETRRKLMAVIERPTVYRRLPEQSIDCDPALHLFLLRNPEVVVNIWQVMGISNMTAERQGPYAWKGNDGQGTICDIELVYGTDDLHVLYSDGCYEGTLIKQKLTGRCVLILKTAYAQTANRRWAVGNRMDVFLQIDNQAADVVARTLSPLVGKVADGNFHECCYFSSRLSQTAEQNPQGMQRIVEKLKQVEPPVRDEFAKITAAVQQRAALRDVNATVQRR